MNGRFAAAVDTRTALNDSQRRGVFAGVHHVAEMLDEVERSASVSAGDTPFERYSGALKPAEARIVRDYVGQARRALFAAAERHGLDLSRWGVDARRSISAHVIAARIDVEEMRPPRLRGYGALDPATASEMDRTCDELERVLGEIQRFAAGGPEEDYAARLTRLGGAVADATLLAELERIVREHGMVEVRPLLGSLLDRVEERTFHVAVFGRVSSGKSSLLNALLGRDLLPVGVTPVTAVPARVRLGSPARLRVRFARGGEEELPLESLSALASEQENPGNEKGVARLEVIYPAAGLPEGVALVDTPGIGALASSGAAETFAYLPRTDLALVLIDAGSTIGPEELGLLRLFQELAIPVELVLSKADLLDAEELQRSLGYLADVVARETGWAPPVGVVSTKGNQRSLILDWAREHLLPRFERRQELAAESVRRFAACLLDVVIASLRRRSGRPAPADSAASGGDLRREFIRAADARVAEARRALDTVAAQSGESLGDALKDAARALLGRWSEGAPRRLEAQPFVATVLASATEAASRQTLSLLLELHSALRKAAREIEPTAGELFEARLPAPDLSGLPMFDTTAAFGDALLARRPWLARPFDEWATRRLAADLQARRGVALAAALRNHSHRLRDFSQRAIDRLAQAFHAAMAPLLHDAQDGARSCNDEGVARDLAALLALQARRGPGSGPAANTSLA